VEPDVVIALIVRQEEDEVRARSWCSASSGDAAAVQQHHEQWQTCKDSEGSHRERSRRLSAASRLPPPARHHQALTD
jgi:hypothetical protein